MKRLFTLAAVLCATLAFGAQQTINLGTAPRGTGGDDNRTAWGKANSNFTELYTSVADLTEDLTLLQPIDSDLTAIAAVGTTPFGRSLLALADAAAGRTAFGVVIGTDVQAFDADLSTYAGITPSANVQTLLGSANFLAFKTSLSLENVENTALSTWAGSTNLTTLGTISAGTWNGSIIGPAYLGTGSSITTKYLRGDGTWQTVTTDTSTLQPLDSDLTSIAALTTNAYGRNLLTLGTADSLRVLTTSYTALGAGTALAVGTNYTATLSADRTLTFSGSPVNGSKISLAFTASTASTLTFPASYRQGDTASITSLAFATGNHTLSWTYDGSRWNLVDTADDVVAANLVMASPDGSSGVMTPRLLVGDDFADDTIAASKLKVGGGDDELNAGSIPFSAENFTASNVADALVELEAAGTGGVGYALSALGPWNSDNIASSQTNLLMTRGGGAGQTTGLVMPAPGIIAALSASTSADITTGTVTATVFKNGVATTMAASIANAQDGAVYAHAPDTITFAAGDKLTLAATTDTIVPTGSAELTATPWIQFTGPVVEVAPPPPTELIVDLAPSIDHSWSISRKTRADYAGALIRVRRDDTDVEHDIGFDPATGLINEADLETKMAGTDGYITIIYDQKGTLNHTQTVESDQLQIVTAGVANKDADGRIYAVNDGNRVMGTASVAGTEHTWFAVFVQTASTSGQYILNSGGTTRPQVRQSSSNSFGIRSGGATTLTDGAGALNTQYIITAGFTTSGTGVDYFALNAGTGGVGSELNTGSNAAASYVIGNSGDDAAAIHFYEWHACQSFVAKDSAEVATVKADLNAFFTVY